MCSCAYSAFTLLFEFPPFTWLPIDPIIALGGLALGIEGSIRLYRILMRQRPPALMLYNASAQALFLQHRNELQAELARNAQRRQRQRMFQRELLRAPIGSLLGARRSFSVA